MDKGWSLVSSPPTPLLPSRGLREWLENCNIVFRMPQPYRRETLGTTFFFPVYQCRFAVVVLNSILGTPNLPFILV